jgi:hypothetical protein
MPQLPDTTLALDVRTDPDRSIAIFRDDMPRLFARCGIDGGR